MEIVKAVEGYNGKYFVTTWGRVLNRQGYEFGYETTKKGYLRVDLYDALGNRNHKKVHRLVAEAFIPNPQCKPQINHIDGNKKNNSVTNLEWCTNEENVMHRKEINKRYFFNTEVE